ncbi:MAG TPA: hypothetical protein VLX60_02340 [Terriglobales bacterium]|nr:hypothetical protein [Terriglobales bacterium]
MKKPAHTKKSTPKPIQGTPRGNSGESLESIYEQLKEILAHHAPPFKMMDGGVRDKRSVKLVVPKPVAIPGAYGGKPVDLQMAAAILQKGYVGFYLMCIYVNNEKKSRLSPQLLKLLKGKSCFYVKALDEGLKKDIEDALVLGTKAYRERGWLEA